ncbi:MAG: TerB N-terminal domain-containing protein [Oscillospiraceae bacterium]|nr:TerB N-terminal domain-containing protein [Oscillospiraceae bacterium]
MDSSKKYASFSIPRRSASQKKPPPDIVPEAKPSLSLHGDFAEIEYERGTVGGFSGDGERRTVTLIPASQLIDKRAPDPVREKFYEMRRLATGNPFARNDSALFYKQAKFMEDFTDDYSGTAPFSMYFPYYQHMSYDQLRTFFTWRAKARAGDFPAVPLSYVFLYIYELLSCIDAKNPADSLGKLIAVWLALREAYPALDRYLPGWIRDFYIYYNLPCSFAYLASLYGIEGFYRENSFFRAEGDGSLAVWNEASAYDITASKFYTGENIQLMDKCFSAVLDALREHCGKRGVRIEDLFIYGVNKGMAWHPFTRALFEHWYRQPDCRIEMPGGNIYHCTDNRWTADILIYHSNRRELAGYIIKKTEACLRLAVKYKGKFTVSPAFLDRITDRQKNIGLTREMLDSVIEKAAADFLREISRTVVTVSRENLARIREEALDTRDKLIVPEEAYSPPPVTIAPSPPQDGYPAADGWAAFKQSLSQTELSALAMALGGNADIKAFAEENGVMPEILADGINEKAMDHIGDNILELDGGMVLYGDYLENIGEMLK